MQENKKKANKNNLKNNKKYNKPKNNFQKKELNNSKNKNTKRNNSKKVSNQKNKEDKKLNFQNINNLQESKKYFQNNQIKDNIKIKNNNPFQEYYPIKKKKVQTSEKNEVQEIKKKENKVLGKSSLELNSQKKSKNKKIILIMGIIILIILLIGGYFTYSKHLDKLEIENQLRKEKEEYDRHLDIIKNSYNEYVLTKEDTNLYNKDLEIVGLVSKGIELELDVLTNPESEYFKLKNYDLYIKYDSINKINNLTIEDERYKNYLPFNLSVITNKDTKLYVSSDSYYILNEETPLPVIIKENDRYYVLLDNKLVYVLKSEATIEESLNSTVDTASSISVLNYHFVIDKSERSLCSPSVICHDESQFDSQMKYLKDNNFYTITMKELEMFIDSKINLPKKSVSITIDDGWFVARSIPILEKYDLMGTLFLIGSLASPVDYQSKNLEIHSHTWNLHNVSNCEGGRSPLLCYSKEKIVKDLLKSRESLNNTPYFCYPFYEYNNHAISALKQAGFKMALTGGNKSVKKGINKYKVPRYVIYDTTTIEKFKQIVNN